MVVKVALPGLQKIDCFTRIRNTRVKAGWGLPMRRCGLAIYYCHFEKRFSLDSTILFPKDSFTKGKPHRKLNYSFFLNDSLLSGNSIQISWVYLYTDQLIILKPYTGHELFTMEIMGKEKR
jgi:hypothetical protein